MARSLNCKKYLIGAVIFSLIPFACAHATVDVTTEAELRTALSNVTTEPSINITATTITLTSDLTMPSGTTFTITGNGQALVTDGFNLVIPTNVKIKNLVIDGVTNYRKNSSSGYGGAINNTSTTNTISGDAAFISNTASSGGGGIYSYYSTNTIGGDATFTSNTTVGNGGGINNYSSLSIINGDAVFTSNTAGNNGGGINNNYYSTSTIGGNATFSGNTAVNGGGGLNNASNSTSTISGDATFTDNTAGYGGGIYNSYSTNTINGDVTFTDNTANSSGGGGLYNDNATTTIGGDADFTGNTANLGGGGIYNLSSTTTISGDASFTNNKANSSGGGGIGNEYSSTSIIEGNATFIGNTAGWGGGINNYSYSKVIINGNAGFSNNTTTYGGAAVYNDYYSTFIAKNGAIFANNSASTKGGAIYSDRYATTTLIADTNNVEFTGNTAASVDNAVYLANISTLNLNASNSAKVIFNDKITTDTTANVINLNKTGTWDDTASPNTPTGNYIPISAPTTGEIILNQDMSGVGSNTTVNLYGGTLTLGNNGTFFNGAKFNAYSGSILNLINNKIDSVTFGTANVNNMNLKVDVNLQNLTSDTVNASAIDTNNAINISKIAVISDNAAGGTVTVNPDNKFNLSLSSNTATGNVYNYSVANNGNGTISLTKTNVNPVVQARSLTSQSACVSTATVNNLTLSRADEIMSTLNTIKNQTGIDYDMVNKVAALKGNAEYSTLYDKLEKGSVWFKPFSNIEQLDVKNIEKDVNSVSYGMVMGYDSPLKKFRHGYKGMMSLYGGQSGANQSYDDVTLYQEGGFAGILGALYKKNFYASLSTNAGGANVVEKVKGYGSANYGLFTTSVASKLSYNINLPKNIAVQLNEQTAYSFVSSKDYTNAQGTTISSDPLHVIQLTPGLKISKLIGNWQPYLSTSMVFNPLNKSLVRANDVVLPETSLGRYVEYGLGIEKYSKNSSSGFVQATMRNGSRTGVNLLFGLKVPVGKKKPESL